MFVMAVETRLGVRIRRARERLDMTQDDLAQRVGRSRSAVNAWETGRAVPMRSIGKLEDVLGVSLDGQDGQHGQPETVVLDPETRGLLERDLGAERARKVIAYIEERRL